MTVLRHEFHRKDAALAAEASYRDREQLVAVRLGGIRYKIGRIDQRVLLQTQNELLESRRHLVDIHGLRLIQRIKLHLSLGGSF